MARFMQIDNQTLKKNIMKAMIDTKRTRRVLTTVVMLTMIFSMSQGQGLLVENASKLFKSLIKSDVEQTTIVLTDYTVEHNSRMNGFINLFNSNNGLAEVNVTSKDFTPSVVMSFTVKSVNVDLDEELVTENWMSESLCNEIETPTVVEDWMIDPLYEDMEASVEVEDWMTAPLYTSMEDEIVVEDWMIQLLN
jgi:hypothetical protein